MLYFSDGLLVKKRYTFATDVIGDIEEKFLKSKNYAVPDKMTRITLSFKAKSLSYERGNSFLLYEQFRVKE